MTSGRVTVVAAGEPTIRIIRTIVQGDALTIELSGFPSRIDVRLAVYGKRAVVETDQNYDLVAELPPIQTDDRGEAFASRALPDSLGPGSYVLWTDPGAPTTDCIGSPCTRFQLTSP